MTKMNKSDFPFLFSQCFLTEIENISSVFLLSYRNTCKGLGELKTALKTLLLSSYSHNIIFL